MTSLLQVRSCPVERETATTLRHEALACLSDQQRLTRKAHKVIEVLKAKYEKECKAFSRKHRSVIQISCRSLGLHKVLSISRCLNLRFDKFLTEGRMAELIAPGDLQDNYL